MMRKTLTTAIATNLVLALMPSHVGGQNVQPVAPGITFDEAASLAIDIIDDLERRGQSDKLTAFGLSHFARLPTNFSQEMPVKIITDLDHADVELDWRIDIKDETFRNTFSWSSMPAFCERIKTNRQSFSMSDVSPVIITSIRLISSLSSAGACSADNLLTSGAELVVMEIPIAVMGLVALKTDEDQLPEWVTLDHVAVASLRKLPDERFGPQRESVQDEQCSKLPHQPPTAELQSALEAAESVLIDQYGRRKIGEYAERHVLRPLRTEHGTHSERNFESLTYPGRRIPNELETWAHVDPGLKDMAIDLRVVDEPLANGGIRRAKDSEFYLCDHLARHVMRQHNPSDCSWREDVTVYDGFDDAWLIDAIRTSGDWGSPLILTWLGRYIHGFQYDFWVSSLIPLVFSVEGHAGDTEAWRLLLRMLRDGEYPAMRTIWMYLDPVSLQDENVRDYVTVILEEGSTSSYRGKLAFFADIVELEETR